MITSRSAGTGSNQLPGMGDVEAAMRTGDVEADFLDAKGVSRPCCKRDFTQAVRPDSNFCFRYPVVVASPIFPGRLRFLRTMPLVGSRTCGPAQKPSGTELFGSCCLHNRYAAERSFPVE